MRLLAAVVLALTLTACASGSNAASAPPASVAPTPTVTPSPTPTTLTMAQARAAYLRVVKRTNTDMTHINKVLVGHVQSLSTFHFWGKRLTRDLHTEAVALRTTMWPTPAAVAVAVKMADADATMVADLQGMVTATSNDEAVAAWEQMATDSGKGARFGEQMREMIGLPSARA